MAELTGSEIIAKCLEKEGIKDLFYIMGGPMLLAEATCIKEGIRMIDVRHEQAAAFACQAYSRLKQVPSVCMAASGPGVTNLVTGMANALVDCCPVVALGGSSPLSQFGRQVFQEIDQVELMRSCSASPWQIFRIVKLPSALPYIFAGLNLAAILSILGALVGEFIGAQAGLGSLIVQMNNNLDMRGVFSVLVLLSAFGLGLHYLLGWFRSKFLFWSPDERNITGL